MDDPDFKAGNNASCGRRHSLSPVVPADPINNISLVTNKQAEEGLDTRSTLPSVGAVDEGMTQ